MRGWEVSTELVELARAGDEAAFSELVEPYRAGLHAHCYRILGSVQDAEDALQETLLAAWRGLAGFQERASVRTWLYSIATNRALNMLRAAKRRPTVELWMPEAELPEPTGRPEPLWLEPYPDVLLEDELRARPDPRRVTRPRRPSRSRSSRRCSCSRPGSAPSSSSATYSASAPRRWPGCSTRASSP